MCAPDRRTLRKLALVTLCRPSRPDAAPGQEETAVSSTVKDVMSTHVMAVRPGAGYKEMAAMLGEQRVSAFPVIDEDNKVIGVVSESDLLVKEALDGTVPGVLRGLTQRHVRSQVTGLTAADLM